MFKNSKKGNATTVVIVRQCQIVIMFINTHTHTNID
jgi:hypothetical protein